MDTSFFAQRSFGENPLLALFYAAIVGYLILRVIFSVGRTTGRTPGRNTAKPPRPPREGLDEADPLEGVEPLNEGVPLTEQARLRVEIRRFQQSRHTSQAVPPPLDTASSNQPPTTVSAASSPTASPIAESVFDDAAPQDSDEPAGSWNAAALAASLQNPSEFKRALLLSEILRRRDWE